MSTSEASRVRRQAVAAAAPRSIRVAIYTRKSTEKGMEQEFTSIDSQREAIEAYVVSQRGKGWAALSTRYDDAGWSGSTLERPAFTQLRADIDAGMIDVVAVYKFDRLSRNFADFVALIDDLDERGVSVVSTTQSIDTSTDVGRLILNVLASFAEYERKQIAERIRDKMGASRRRGLWQGGRPLLGYDVVAKKLVANEAEADHVRAIFDTFLRTKSVVATLADLDRRGARNKSWTTQTGKVVTGRPFDANGLRRLLGNVVYAGRLHAGAEVVDGDQPAIVPQATWEAVQDLLGSDRSARSRKRKPSGALLQGLLRCASCGGGMVAHYALKGTRRYGFYVCATQRRRGKSACSGSRAPLGEMEEFVIGRIRETAQDPALVAQVVAAAGPEVAVRCEQVAQDLRRAEAEVRRLQGADNAGAAEAATQRAVDLRAELAALKGQSIDVADLAAALASFDAIWEALFTAERSRVLHLLLDRIVYDAANEQLTITYRPRGVADLAHGEEVAAA